MPAYVFATVKSVKDRRAVEEYWSRAGATFEGTGAKHLVVYTPFKLLEGNGPVEGIVAIEFPDMDAAQRWYESPAYPAIKQYRDGAADIDFVLVDGGVVTDRTQRMPHIKANVQKP